MHTNFEFKARTADVHAAEKILQQLNPVFKGEDHQIDTYFNVKSGRLKLREGNIENALIYYERNNTAGAKTSEVILYPHETNSCLKELLIKAHGVKAIVDKIRKIYFIDNVKFHFDKVKGIGSFIEVEAIDEHGDFGKDKIRAQCDYYAELFKIAESDYVGLSYSDIILSSLPVEERIKLSGITSPI